jgi:putative spermidine/putrescine transport system ATP-binding protein
MTPPSPPPSWPNIGSHVLPHVTEGNQAAFSVTGSAAVSIRNVRKTFGAGANAVHAVDDVSLDIVNGEFFCLLGPSGSGKTTLLRMIAGFELPTAGTIVLGGIDVTGTPPFARDVNTVFQDYALFPHMSVFDNVEYGLRVKKVPKSQRKVRVEEALQMVQLEQMGKRKPSQLSGGQRQRIALARALVNRPQVLLLDEPLGALDLKLRQQMQIELKTIQQQAGITFIFVTHDQEEALTMSDRIAVFNNGKIEQVGTPREMYEYPTSPFVAGFVGTSNLLEGESSQALLQRSGTFTIRPERISVHSHLDTIDPGFHQVAGVVQHVEFLGPFLRYAVSVNSGIVLSVLAANTGAAVRVFHPNDPVVVAFDPESAVKIGESHHDQSMATP